MNRARLLAALLLVGCATTPTAPDRATPVPAERLLAFQERTDARSATLIVARDSGFVGSACFLSLFVNGIHAARFDVGETAQFHVEPGEVLLRNGSDVEGRGLCAFGGSYWTQRETTLKVGETKRFRLSIDSTGKTDIQRAD